MKMPTQETQAAFDAAYMQAVQGPPFFEEETQRKESPTEAEVMVLLATTAGRLAGMNDWALKNGIKTTLLGHDVTGHS
jgi:hypothetical protein